MSRSPRRDPANAQSAAAELAEQTIRGRTQGAQTIDRAAAILRIIGNYGGAGVSLKQATIASMLHKATVYRILRALMDNGLVEYTADARTYRLGFEILALHAAMGERFDLKGLAQPTLDRLAHLTEDTAYLAVRSGYDGLCISVVEGAHPQKALRLSVGARWPLGVGTLNLAILAFLHDAEIREIITHNESILEGQDEYAPAAIYRYIEETRERGYAVKSSGVFPTMCGVGVPIFDSHRRPIAALSVIAIAARMEHDRREWMAGLLWAESKKISEQRAALPVTRPESDLWKPGSPRRIIGWDTRQADSAS